ncbi:uncharacterized protein [Temnothorax longispinosus]|uniref:uncharacterized protein n=1 Tax=Temnothorax longispinosus TaxID=300112 RepID=UPI003A996DB0
MAELWDKFQDIEDECAQCKICKKKYEATKTQMIKALQRHLLEIHNIISKPAVPYHLRDYYTSSNGSAKCRAAECKYTTKINTKDLVDHKKTDHPDWTINPRPNREKPPLRPCKTINRFFKIQKKNPSFAKCNVNKCGRYIWLNKNETNQVSYRRHMIFVHNVQDQTHTLSDEYLKDFDNLPEFKAKCRTCGSVISYLRDVGHLNEHLNKSVRCRTKDQHKPSTSSSTPYIKDPSTGKYIPAPQSQEQVPSGLHVQSFKETAENTGVLDESSTALPVSNMDASAEQIIQKWPVAREQLKTNFIGIDKAVESAFKTLEQYSRSIPLPEQTTEDPGAVDKPSISALTISNMGSSAADGIQKQPNPQIVEQLLTTLKTIKEAVKSAFKSLEDDSPPVPTLKQMTKDSDAVDKPSTSTSEDDMSSSAEHSIQEQSISPGQESILIAEVYKETVEKVESALEGYKQLVSLPEQTIKNQGAFAEPSTSASTVFNMGSCAEQEIRDRSVSPNRQGIKDVYEIWKEYGKEPLSEEPSWPVLSPEPTTKSPGAVDTPSTSALPVSNMGPFVEQTIQGLPISPKQIMEEKWTEFLKGINLDVFKEQRLPVPLPEQTTKDPGAVDKYEKEPLSVASVPSPGQEFGDKTSVSMKAYPEAAVKQPNFEEQFEELGEQFEGVKEDFDKLSISTPTSCVTDPSEADTDDTHEQKSGEPDTDGTRKRKSTEVDIDDTRKRRSGGADDDE